MANTTSRRRIIPRWILGLIGFSSLAAAVISVAIYIYKRNAGSTKKSLPPHSEDDPTTSASNATSTNQSSTSQKKISGWSLLSGGSGSSSKKRKRVTISLKNTILWNPSSDVETPNHAFHEHGQALLSQLLQQHDVYIIIHVTDDEEKAQMERLLENGALDGLDTRKVLYCSTEEGKIHIIRHLEPQLHIEGGWEYDDGEDIIRKVRPFVAKVIWVITKRRRCSFNQANIKADDQGVLGTNVELTDHLLDTSLARDLGFTTDY